MVDSKFNLFSMVIIFSFVKLYNMARIIIQNLYQKEIIFKPAGKNVLKILLEGYVDWLHSCGGKGNCTTCKMVVVSGGQNLSPLTSAEKNYKSLKLLNRDQRLACQTIPSGDLSILVPKDTQLPHLKYS
jgi:2Fe-2S ferredoxin